MLSSCSRVWFPAGEAPRNLPQAASREASRRNNDVAAGEDAEISRQYLRQRAAASGSRRHATRQELRQQQIQSKMQQFHKNGFHLYIDTVRREFRALRRSAQPRVLPQDEAITIRLEV